MNISVYLSFPQFAPDLVIVAAGFDAEKTDPLVRVPSSH